MPKDDFYIPTDIDALRMENELLAFEVRFLKAQLADSERHKDQLAETQRSLKQAETDLALLLERVTNSPFGWYFRLQASFRAFEQRYSSTDA